MSYEECKVHLVHFYDWEPRAIHCLAYERHYGKLAVSRADHSVEVWDLSKPEAAPHIEYVIPNLKDNTVESLAWSGTRLFSTGFQGFVVEYDTRTLSKKYAEAVTGGPAWCMAVNNSNQYLAVGTEDGYVNIFSVEEDHLRYDKLMDKQKGRIMCIAWEHSGQMIVTGSVNNIVIWDVKTGHAINKMTTGHITTNKKKIANIIWSLAVTNDFTVISGDSSGQLIFWNGHLGVQEDSFETHVADILTVCTDGPDVVYASGVDPTVVKFHREKVVTRQSAENKWMRGWQRRWGDHDIRALVIAHGSVVAGGVDGSLFFYKERKCAKFLSLVQGPVMILSREARCMLLRYLTRLEVWQLGEENVCPDPTRLLSLESCGGDPIICAAISPNAQWLIYSTPLMCRFFTFVLDLQAPSLQKITHVPEEVGPAHKAVFTNDGTHAVVATCSGPLLVVQLSGTDLGEVTLVHSLHPLEEKILTERIYLMQVSEDGKFLVAADHSSHIVVWTLQDGQVYCSLPRCSYPPTALAFEPGTNNIIVTYSDKSILEYDLIKRGLTDFSNKMEWPQEFRELNFPILGITFHRQNSNILIVYDQNYMYVIRKKFFEKFETPVWHGPDNRYRAREQARKEQVLMEQGVRGINKYKYIVQLDWLMGKELVVVQLAREDMIEKLPPVLRKKKYGT